MQKTGRMQLCPAENTEHNQGLCRKDKKGRKGVIEKIHVQDYSERN